MPLAIYAEQQWKQSSILASVKHVVSKTPIIYRSSELVIQDLFLITFPHEDTFHTVP
jgi:hypothetical protein